MPPGPDREPPPPPGSRSVRCVWFLPDLKGGGAERLPLVLAGSFHAIEVRIVLLRDVREHAAVDSVPIAGLGRPGRLRAAWPGVVRDALRECATADVIVGGLEWSAMELAAACGFVRRTPVLGMAHTDLQHFYANDRISPFRWWMLSRAYRSCARVVAVSEDVRRALIALGVPNERIRVIANPVPMRELPPRMPPSPRAPGPWTALIVGRLHHAKGVDVALRAAAQTMDLPLRWQIMGDGPERAALERLRHELGIADRVQFLGFEPDPAPRYHAADLFVLPSRIEGANSLALMEAMAHGLPVVATRCGAGVEQALEGGRAGRLVSAEDPGALAAAIRDLVTHPEQMRATGDAARTRAADFLPAAVAARYESVLLELAGR